LNDLILFVGNLLSNVDSEGDTDEIGIFELNSRAFVTVVEENVEPSGFEFAGQVNGDFEQFGVETLVA